MINFKDESLSPDGSPERIEAIPESQELDILGGLEDDDSLNCDENSYEEPKLNLDFQEDECDLVDDDFFQNLINISAKLLFLVV